VASDFVIQGCEQTGKRLTCKQDSRPFSAILWQHQRVARAHLPSSDRCRSSTLRAARDCCLSDKPAAELLLPFNDALLACSRRGMISALAMVASYRTAAAGAPEPDCRRSSDGAPCAGLSGVNEGAGTLTASKAFQVRSTAAIRAPAPHGLAPARWRRIHWRSGCRAGSRH